MNTIKKLALILIIILASSSGLLFGCQALYSKMKLDISVEEITLYLTDTEEEGLEEPVGEEETVEEPVSEEEPVESITTFTASIKNLPKNTSNNILVNFSIAGIAKVEQVEKNNDTNTTTFEVTALKAGATVITLKTTEGNKQVSVPVVVIEPVEKIEANTNFNPMVIVGERTNINTIETLKFSPATTNQKDVVFSLVNNEENVELTEAGFITVSQKTSEYIAVRAISTINQSLYAEFLVKVIEPILTEDINLAIGETVVETVELSSNVLGNSWQDYKVLVENTTEDLKIELQVNTNNNLDIEKLNFNEFRLRSIELGQATLSAVISVVGYEQYNVVKNFDVSILEYPTYVSINNQVGIVDNQEIFDQYVSARGAPFNLKVGTIGAYDKRMILQISEEDAAKVEITRSDGVPINIEEDILPNNITIYIKAKVDELGQIATSASLKVISFASIEAGDPVESTLNMVLRRGAEDLVLTSPDNEEASLSIEQYQTAIISFIAEPEGASLGEVNLYAINSGIVSFVKVNPTQFSVQGLKVGSTRLTLVSSNGINKNIEVDVYVPLTDITLNLPSPSENTAVATISKVSTSANNQTLSNITISVGTGLALQINKYPSTANIISTSYLSQNSNVASISASGYIVARALGETTIIVNTGYLFNLGNGESEIRYISRQFTLNVYMPILSTQLNHYQATLFDANTLGFSEAYKSRLQLNLNINPANATFNQSSIVWQVSGNYATISPTGLLQVSLPAEINSATINVTATIVEYSRYYVQKATITIKKPVKVGGISVLNVEDRIYFDARHGLGVENKLTAGLMLQARTYPTNASNTTLTYRFIENTAIQDQLGLTDEEKVKPVVIIEPNGLIIPNRVGSGILHIIAQDSYTTANNYTQFVAIPVRVADGVNEARAIEISSAQDLFNINTLQGLGLHYVLSKTIDLTGVTIAPIGIIDGIDYGFSGALSGDFRPFGFNVENQIIGANFNISTTERTNYISLFSSLINGGKIENLTLKVNTLSANLSSNVSGTISYVSPLVSRIQSGTVNGVKVELVSSLIELSNRTNYVGGIAAHVSAQGQITNSRVWGQLNIKERQGITSIPLMHIGGITGYNAGEISGSFLANSLSLLDNFASYNSNIKVIVTGVRGVQNTLGGLVGYNVGEILGVTTNSSVSGQNNVGGAVGNNTGNLSNILASGFVKGVNNVGGLVGQDEGTTDNSLVLVFDQFALDSVVVPQIIGQNNVGGFVGSAINSTISYSYVRSFYTRQIDQNLYSGDLQIIIPSNPDSEIYAGGFIGKAQTANLNTIYAQLNINITDPNSTNVNVYAGGLIGGNTSLLSLQNAYSKGVLLAEATSTVGGTIGVIDYNGSIIQRVYSVIQMQADTVGGIVGNVLATVQILNSIYLDTSATSNSYGNPVTIAQLQEINTYTSYTFSFVSLGGAPFEIDEDNNNGTAYLMYQDNVNPMLIKVPTDIQVEVSAGITSESEVKNNHFKIDNKKAVVYYYQNAIESLNVYSLDNTSGVYGNPIIQKTFTPSDTTNLINFISSNPSVIRILENGLIEVLAEGVATITAYSILDKNVYDEFEIASVKPVTNFIIYEEDLINNTIREISMLNGEINMKVGDKKRIYPELFATMNGTTYLYNTTTNLHYTTTNPTSVSMDGFNWPIDDFYTNILISEAHILRADYARYGVDGLLSSTLTVTPRILVSFESSQEVLSLDFLQKQFDVKVMEGSTQLTTQTSEANISPKDIFTLDLTLKTDIPSTDTEPYTSITEVKSVERVTGIDEQGNYITVVATDELNILKERQIDQTVGNTIVDRYSIEIKNKTDKVLYSTEQKYIVTLASYDRSIDGEALLGEMPSLTQQVILNIIPQNVLRIDANYYPANEVFEYESDQFHNPNELPSNYIMAGKIGLLKLSIYPEYANADYVDLTYSSNRSNTMSLEQVAYVFEENDPETDDDNVVGYAAIYPQAEAIPNGIRLRLKSVRGSEIAGSGGLYNYSFDGNLYVRLLIGTEVGNDTFYTLTAIAYSESQAQPVEMLRRSITLQVEPATQLQIIYNQNKNYKYVPIGVSSEIFISVSKLQIVDPVNEIKFNVPSELQSLITITYSGQYQQNGFILEYKYNVFINYDIDFDFTKTIKIQAYVERTINNNKQQYKSNEFIIRPVLFTIDAIDYVLNVNTTSKTYEVAFGGTYPLNIVLETTYNLNAPSEDKSYIQGKIDELQTIFSQNLSSLSNQTSTWYTRSISAQGNEDTMLEEKNYINYTISKIGSQVSIQPKRVSSGDRIVAKVKFAYIAATGLPVEQIANLEGINPGVDELNNITIEYEFSTNFYLRTEEDNPIPIYDVEGFLEMQEDGHYILMQDLVLGATMQDAWRPITTKIASLDGNSYSITIHSFELEDEISSSTKNYGLFAEINEQTTLKNVTVIMPSMVINATPYEEVNFGGLVAINNGGVIYNSYVYSGSDVGNTGVKITLSSTINQKNTIAYIGGLVGQNAGYIVNSRSELRLEANKGYIAGLTANNTGVISGSYYKNGQIKNTSLTKLNSAVAGLVVFNANNAKIMTSFVEGKTTQLETAGNLITGRILGGGLEFSGDLAGFVYENHGSISNSYANIKVVSQSRSAGFAFNNRGVITSSHSMSRVAYNVAAHTPFIGTNEQGAVLNLGSVTGSYYLTGDFANTATQPATVISKENWQISDTFKNLSFSKGSDEYFGTWKMKTLVNSANELDEMNYPTLVSANHIAASKKEMSGQVENPETGETKYNYTYLIENEGEENEINYTAGTKLNPLTIQNSSQFNAILTEQAMFKQYVRIIKDFNFEVSEIVETSKIDFAGVLDGNGMTITNINVITGSQTATNAIGLFRSIVTDGETVGLVKNLNLKFNEVFANEKTYVGALAGYIHNGNVYDVTIDNPNTVVQGKHLVGGVAGKISGNSHLINIAVSISVNASFRQNVNTSIVYDIYNGSNDTSLSYAGAVAGLVDVTANGRVENISIKGNSSVLAETVGGAFGLTGSTTTVNNIIIEIEKEQFVRTTKVAGGIVGENRGTLNNAIIRHTTNVQNTIDSNITSKNFGLTNINQNTTFFAGIGQMMGGLVGFNNGGNIVNSVSKLDVRNQNIKIAGGLIGRSTGGNITNSYTYGSVLGGQVTGGLIGAVTKNSLLAAQSGSEPNIVESGLIKYMYLGQIANTQTVLTSAYAYNNWLSSDYNALLENNIIIGGIVGVVQNEDLSKITATDKNNIEYNNSIYRSNSYNSLASWHYISEYGLQKNSLEVSYVESYKLSDYSQNTGKLVNYGEEDPDVIDYPDVNDDNVLANGFKIFEITFFPA